MSGGPPYDTTSRPRCIVGSMPSVFCWLWIRFRCDGSLAIPDPPSGWFRWLLSRWIRSALLFRHGGRSLSVVVPWSNPVFCWLWYSKPQEEALQPVSLFPVSQGLRCIRGIARNPGGLCSPGGMVYWGIKDAPGQGRS